MYSVSELAHVNHVTGKHIIFLSSLFPQVVFLDDLGQNLKPARELGMATVKVEDPRTAVRELEHLLCIQLTDSETMVEPLVSKL